MYKSIFFIYLAINIIGCTGSNMAGQAGTQRVAAKTTGGTPGGNTAGSPTTGGSTAGNTTGGNSFDGGGATGGNNGGGSMIDDGGGCANKVTALNIVFVFDKSGSMSNSALALQASVGQAAIDTLAGFIAQKNNKPQVNVAVIYFSSDPVITGNWVNLNSGGGGAAKNAIAAYDTNGGDTYYSKALGLVGTGLFAPVANLLNPTMRNFVLFFSDGQPETSSDLSSAITTAGSLTQQFGVALHSVGVDAGNSGMAALNQIALPKTGIVDANHIGRAYQAGKDSSSLNAALTQAMSSVIGACQ